MLNYSWRTSPNRWGRSEFNALFFGNELSTMEAQANSLLNPITAAADRSETTTMVQH